MTQTHPPRHFVAPDVAELQCTRCATVRPIAEFKSAYNPVYGYQDGLNFYGDPLYRGWMGVCVPCQDAKRAETFAKRAKEKAHREAAKHAVDEQQSLKRMMQAITLGEQVIVWQEGGPIPEFVVDRLLRASFVGLKDLGALDAMNGWMRQTLGIEAE